MSQWLAILLLILIHTQFPTRVECQSLDHGLAGDRRDSYGRMYSPVPSQTASSDSLFSVIGRWPWGPCEGVDVEGEHVFIGSGPTVQVLQITDPTHPVVVGEYVSQGYIYDVRLDGSIAYIAAGNSLVILDVSEPTHPVGLASLDVGHIVSRVSVSDSFVFVSGFPGNVTTIDVTDPRSPRVRGRAPSLGGEWPDCMVAGGRFLYFGNNESANLGIVDARDPDSLHWGWARIDGFAHAGFVRDTLLFLGMVDYDFKEFMAVLSVASGDTAVELAKVQVPERVAGIVADSATVYVSCLYTGRALTIDIRDLQNPQIRREYIPEWPQWRGRGRLATMEGLILDPYWGSGLRTFDARDPDSLKLLSFFSTGGTPEQIVWQGDQAYVASGLAGLWILDASDPAQLRPITNLRTGGYVSDVRVNDSLIFLACYAQAETDRSSGLWIARRQDPDPPVIVSHYIGISRDPPGTVYPNTIGLLGGLVLLTQMGGPEYDSTLEVIDVSSPENPRRMSVIEAGLSPYGVSTKDSLAIVSYGPDGGKTFDLSNPGDPVEIAAVPHLSIGVHVADTVAYLLGPYVYSVSIARPSTPVVLDTAFLTTGLVGMSGTVSGGHLYWAGAGKVGSVDISDPGALKPEGEFHGFLQGIRCVAATDGIAIAGETYAGLWVLRRNPTVSVRDDEPARRDAQRIRLFQSSPNPCNAQTTIRFETSLGGEFRLTLYDILGRSLRTLAGGVIGPGAHAVHADLSGLPSATYFYRLEAQGSSAVGKLLLIR
jgi:hypothetical protein